MKKTYFETPDGLKLLCDWSGGCYDRNEYTKNEQRAKRAAARLFRSGALVFEHGSGVFRRNALHQYFRFCGGLGGVQLANIPPG